MQLENLVQPDILIEPVEDTLVEDQLEPLYKVIIHNDDITPYDFVIIILVRFFELNAKDAEGITWTAHNDGVALVQVFAVE